MSLFKVCAFVVVAAIHVCPTLAVADPRDRDFWASKAKGNKDRDVFSEERDSSNWSLLESDGTRTALKWKNRNGDYVELEATSGDRYRLYDDRAELKRVGEKKFRKWKDGKWY